MTPTPSPARLPLGALLAFAMTGFICIMTETLPAGLLPAISAGLDVSPSLAGQTVTLYALGSVLAAIPLTVATRRWSRRRALLATVAGFIVFNSMTALSSNYELTLLARLGAGAAAGLAWSLLAGYARRIVDVSQQGQAMAIAMLGAPIALSLGVPAGTWLGNLIGWRMAFGAMTLMALGLVLWILACVPDLPGQQAHERRSVLSVLRLPGISSILAVVVCWMLAHNILYTYIAPFASEAGLGERVDQLLLAFGLASLLGIYVTGRLIDRFLRIAVLASLAGFALIALLFALATPTPVLVLAGTFVWGLSFGGAATLLQTALADTAGAQADDALSMNVVVWNSAIAAAGVAGGALLEHFGAGSFPWAVLALALLGFACASAARRHGFAAGARETGRSLAAGH